MIRFLQPKYSVFIPIKPDSTIKNNQIDKGHPVDVGVPFLYHNIFVGWTGTSRTAAKERTQHIPSEARVKDADDKEIDGGTEDDLYGKKRDGMCGK